LVHEDQFANCHGSSEQTPFCSSGFQVKDGSDREPPRTASISTIQNDHPTLDSDFDARRERVVKYVASNTLCLGFTHEQGNVINAT
jgi:hypothetical protein